jgi:hypothetical protein
MVLFYTWKAKKASIFVEKFFTVFIKSLANCEKKAIIGI